MGPLNLRFFHPPEFAGRRFDEDGQRHPNQARFLTVCIIPDIGGIIVRVREGFGAECVFQLIRRRDVEYQHAAGPEGAKRRPKERPGALLIRQIIDPVAGAQNGVRARGQGKLTHVLTHKWNADARVTRAAHGFFQHLSAHVHAGHPHAGLGQRHGQQARAARAFGALFSGCAIARQQSQIMRRPFFIGNVAHERIIDRSKIRIHRNSLPVGRRAPLF